MVQHQKRGVVVDYQEVEAREGPAGIGNLVLYELDRREYQRKLHRPRSRGLLSRPRRD